MKMINGLCVMCAIGLTMISSAKLIEITNTSNDRCEVAIRDETGVTDGGPGRFVTTFKLGRSSLRTAHPTEDTRSVEINENSRIDFIYPGDQVGKTVNPVTAAQLQDIDKIYLPNCNAQLTTGGDTIPLGFSMDRACVTTGSKAQSKYDYWCTH